MLTSKKILLLLLIVAGNNAFSQLSQISEIDGLSGSLISKIRSSASERIFVQTDKTIYNAGEKLWFKAYCLSTLTGKPVYNSKTLFIDIVNDNDSIVTQAMLHNENGSTDGYITISPFINSGYYWLRCFSKNIINSNPGNAFVSPVYIYNPFSQGAVPFRSKNNVASDNTQSRLDLFPEGGSIIAGINCVTAFRAYDKDGNPAEISGYVTDNRDTVTTRFQTTSPGLGKFNFEVWANRKYTVHIKDKNNEEFTYPLPPVRQTAAQLSVTSQNNEELNLQVALGDSLYNKNFVTYLLGISKDSLCFAATGKGMYNVAIPKKDIPPGKATFLLFNEKQQIISERNVYINRDNDVLIDIKPDKNNYGARDKVNLAVAVSRADKQTEPALLSIAVTNDTLVNSVVQEPLVTSLKFSDIDFPGKTLQPDKIKSYSQEQWDLVMLTQKYKYRQLLSNEMAPAPAHKDKSGKEDETTIMKKITGKVLDKNNETIDNVVLTLFSNQQALIVLKDTTDAKGRFQFDLPYIPEDSTLFTIKTESQKNSRMKIVVDELQFPVFKTPASLKQREYMLSEKQIGEAIRLQSDSVLNAKGKELKEVTVKSKTVSLTNSHTISGKDLAQGVGGIRNALLTIPGVQFKSGFLVIHGGTDMFHLDAGSEPLVVINGVATPGEDGGGMESSPDLALLNTIPVNTIDNITVLGGTDAAMYGARGGNGVILVTTSSTANNYIPVESNSPEKRFYSKTYLKSIPFPEQDYSKKNKNKPVSSDYQSTVYWNGSTLTGKDGKAVYNFYTTDATSVYTVTLTGVTAKGNFIYTQAKINQQQ
ncbi:MAG: TonB-dependent receptor plug domain-containing protein [Bacteroidota bacterium]